MENERKNGVYFVNCGLFKRKITKLNLMDFCWNLDESCFQPFPTTSCSYCHHLDFHPYNNHHSPASFLCHPHLDLDSEVDSCNSPPVEAVALDSKHLVVDAPRDTVEPVVERTRDVDYGVQEVDDRHLEVVGSRCPVGVGNSCIGGLEVAVATRALRYGCCFGGSCHGCYQSSGSS